MTDLTKIDKPFGELGIETKLALHRAFYEGATFERHKGLAWLSGFTPLWDSGTIYRVKAEPLRDISVPWEAIHPRWKWAARDADGDVYVYESLPNTLDGTGAWSGSNFANVTDVFANIATFQMHGGALVFHAFEVL